MSKHACIDTSAIEAGEGEHKVFSKEVSGKKVSDQLFVRLFKDPELNKFWRDSDTGSMLPMATITHQQDVMMEIAFGAGLLPEDITYLKQVHADAIQYNGLTERHFDLFVVHFEETLKELQKDYSIPLEKISDAVKNMKDCRVIFSKKK